jgi:hypothetical protein
MWLKTTEHGVNMNEILEIGFSEEYEVHFSCVEIPQPPGMYHLKIVSKSIWKQQEIENKKEFFLEKKQLMMICDYFNGVKNELNK